MPSRSDPPLRHLVVVLGDQLDARSTALDGFDPRCDAIWMAEVPGEATHVWSHKARITLFLSAMRHFRDALRARGWRVIYRQLDDTDDEATFATAIRHAARRLRPRKLVLVQPGEWRVQELFQQAARDLEIELDMRPDRHFLCSPDEFACHAEPRKQLRLEFFYRDMRRATGVLMDEPDQPAGGRWNYDVENRHSFGRAGPAELPLPLSFPPDLITRDVIRLVRRRFASHPGNLDQFDWPVTPAQAEHALDDFITYRLPRFGEFQDAMWTDEPFLYHSLLSPALNLKFLDPRTVLEKTEFAFRSGAAPLAATEGFVRQILGWREYVRGVYWRYMPEYAARNFLQADRALPRFYWTADTDMNCLHHVIRQTLEYGYAHHIQRLMITGLFALLLGVDPKAVHAWYLAVYVDAVEWVELPNTLGMSQFADHGIMASKPYVASGKYIQRMSNYCTGCRYAPQQACGDDACPFTTLYWDFLRRHQRQLAGNPRMTMQLRNLDRKSPGELRDVRDQATRIRARLGGH
jgi:deoxyribodipyrimidine photolyase-related protein